MLAEQHFWEHGPSDTLHTSHSQSFRKEKEQKWTMKRVGCTGEGKLQRTIPNKGRCISRKCKVRNAEIQVPAP